MRLLLSLLFFVLLLFVSAAPAVQKEAGKEDDQPLLMYGKQHRRTAADLKAYYEQMRKKHANYIPNYPDEPVITQMAIGTPPAYFYVSQETGSEATFVLAKDYAGRNVSNNQPFYDPAQSSTSQLIGTYRGFAGDLEAMGSAYEDVLGMLTFPVNTTQRFGVVNDVYDEYFSNPSMPDGIIGMSWNPDDAANPNENSSAIINLFKELGHDHSRYWCQWLNVSTDPRIGRVVFMTTSFAKCLSVCEEPAATNTYPLVWIKDTRSLSFTIDSFGYNGQQLAGGYAKVDTGVPQILLPYDSFLAVHDDVGPTYDWQHGLYTVDCSQAAGLPDWVFTIGGHDYAVPSTAYVVDLVLGGGQCALSVHLSDLETTDYVLGYPFHDLWCLKMDIDNQSISILKTVSQ